jgi:hypothetical protein
LGTLADLLEVTTFGLRDLVLPDDVDLLILPAQAAIVQDRALLDLHLLHVGVGRLVLERVAVQVARHRNRSGGTGFMMDRIRGR